VTILHLTVYFLQHVFNIIPPSCLSLVCLLANIVLLGTSLVRTTNGMQYRPRCNIFTSLGNALLFMYICKGRLVKISENIAFLFYKEINIKYLILCIIRSFISGKPFTILLISDIPGGRRGHDRMVVGFTTTYAISAYHH